MNCKRDCRVECDDMQKPYRGHSSFWVEISRSVVGVYHEWTNIIESCNKLNTKCYAEPFTAIIISTFEPDLSIFAIVTLISHRHRGGKWGWQWY